MKNILLMGAAALAVTACSPTYSDTLEQKLAGKSDKEKRVILAQECGSEVNNGMKAGRPGSAKHYDNFRRICEEMTGHKINSGGAK